MRISVNLATRPFVELRPFFLRLRLAMGALAVTGAGLALGAHLISARAEKQQIELDKLRNVTIATQNARLETEARMRQPENAAVLDRAHFLNAMFLRKSFSWTAVMMDLEDVLPLGVQVTSIEPAVSTDGTVQIRLRVAGERDRAVQLVRNLERSHRFLQPRLGSEAAQAKETAGSGTRAASTGSFPVGPAGVEFEILANYNPLPAGEPFGVGHGKAARAVSAVSPSPAGSAVAPQTMVAVPAAVAETAPTPAPMRPASTGKTVPGNQPNANGRNGYPRNGVVLPPYGGPPRPQDGRLRTAAPADPANGGGPL